MDAALTRPGFSDGLKSLFSGVFWLVTTPGAWLLALVPVGAAMILFGGLGYLSYAFIPDWIAGLLGPVSGTMASFGVGLLQVLGVLLGLVVSLLLGLALAQPISGPALEALVRKRRDDLGAPATPPSPFWVDVGRALQSLVVGYAIGLPLLAVLFVLSLVVPVASVVLFPLKLFVSALIVAWDFCDYPLSVRGLPIRERINTVWHYRGAVLGFGVALALAGMVPLLLFLLLPAGVAGAAQLLWRIEAFEATIAAKPA